MIEPDDDAPELDGELPSKSQRKREMRALRDLGERITELPRAQRDELPGSERLVRALEEFDRIRSREARRRHLSFIGKVLRSEDVDALSSAIDAFDAASATHTRALHALEAWRDALLASDAALDEFLERWPTVDRPRLRNLLRAARRERDATDPGAAPQRRRYRELFQLLREETAEGTELLPPPRR
ncbi:MAG: ribosome biogenesis factor YjgA [Pseudomonadales bacterium]|nr:ribosome biogenesis factor YjgA [Pseudomonadales bacterium]